MTTAYKNKILNFSARIFSTVAFGAFIILGNVAYAPVEQPSLDELPSQPPAQMAPALAARPAAPQTPSFTIVHQQPVAPQFPVAAPQATYVAQAEPEQIAPPIRTVKPKATVTMPSAQKAPFVIQVNPSSAPAQVIIQKDANGVEIKTVGSRWMVAFNGLVAVAVIFLAAFNFLLWRSTRKLWTSNAQPVETKNVVSESARVASAMEKIAESIAKESDEPVKAKDAAETPAKTEATSKSRKKVA